MKLKVKSIKELMEIVKEIKKAGCPYKYITIDTITAVADFLVPAALNDYILTEDGQKHLAKLQLQGKTAADINLFLLPFGKGYSLLRAKIQKLIDMVASVTEHVIIIGHVKLGTADGEDSDVTKTLDLPGAAKRALARDSDAIGYVYRDENSNLCINFESVDAEAGARPRHLANKRIVVAEYHEETDTFTSHWERIYPSESAQ